MVQRHSTRTLPPADFSTVFDSTFLAKLEQLYLLSKRLFAGSQRAERRSRQLGTSLDFADYREYARGDDLRSIDWNAYGRLDRLFVKLFEAEQDLPVHILVDASASMHWSPAPGAGKPKLLQALHVAASLAYVGLAGGDRVDLQWFGPNLGKEAGLSRGKGQFHKFLEYLKYPPEFTGATNFIGTARSFTQATRRRGLVVIISDLFDPLGYQEGCQLLLHAGFTLHLVQVLTPEELRPNELGDLRLIDAETGQGMEVTADPGLLRQYIAAVEAYQEELHSFCRERAIGLFLGSTAVPFEEVILKLLRGGALVR